MKDKKIAEYRVLAASLIKDFEEEVNKKLEEGFELYGRAFYADSYLFQVVIKCAD